MNLNSTSPDHLLFAEKDRIQKMLAQVADSLSSAFFRSVSSHDKAGSPEGDVLQHVLDCTRDLLQAEKCALFLEDLPATSLVLERASGRVDFGKLKDIATYDLRNTGPGSGVTPWVHRRRRPFNAKNFDELRYNSEGHWKGNWDTPMYGGSDLAKAKFQCVYMVPLLAGDRSIGVLKYENRLKGKTYFDQQDERLIDIISALVANLVISQRIERNRYDRILPMISGALVSHLDNPSLYEELLETCRGVLNADTCSLFLLNEQGHLLLECVAGVPSWKREQLQGFGYRDYVTAHGLTPWILRRRMSFNVRSYPDLRGRSENHHSGQWDDIIYDGRPEELFKSLYSIPLIVGEEPIGVFKVENKNLPPYYFTESDERLFDLIGRLIAVGVRYAKARKNEQFLMHMARAAELGFLAAGISHEFNGYLQSFLSNARYAALESRDEKAKGAIEDIINGIGEANKVIDVFRNMRSTSRGATTCDIDDTINHILLISRARFLSCAVEVLYKNDGVQSVHLNAGELQSVLINLLNNAFASVTKTDGRRTVEVRVRPHGQDDFTIDVADSGIGIPKKDVPLLFVPFYTTDPGGMGIGLYVVQRLVTGMGGKIDIVPENERGGATFTVTLPRMIKVDNLQ